MGVGYSVSPLHRIQYFEPVEGAPLLEPRPDDYLERLMQKLGGLPDRRPREWRSPPRASIIEWRRLVMASHREQLGEDLFWDEYSSFETSEDVAASADMLLRFVAATLDREGSSSSRRRVGIMTRPEQSDIEAILSAAEAKGATGRFPQLLLGARYWLPIQRNVVIDHPDWRGNAERYGSLQHLNNEIEQVRAFITAADPDATVRSCSRDWQGYDLFAAAWQAGDTISRLCKVAMDQRIPLWTTG